MLMISCCYYDNTYYCYYYYVVVLLLLLLLSLLSFSSFVSFASSLSRRCAGTLARMHICASMQRQVSLRMSTMYETLRYQSCYCTSIWGPGAITYMIYVIARFLACLWEHVFLAWSDRGSCASRGTLSASNLFQRHGTKLNSVITYIGAYILHLPQGHFFDTSFWSSGTVFHILPRALRPWISWADAADESVKSQGHHYDIIRQEYNCTTMY